MAKKALAEKVKQDKLIETCQNEYDKMSAQVNEMQSQVNLLNQKIEEARSKQAMLVARSQMADAKEKMAKTLGNLDTSSAFAKMDKMEEKVAAKEARAEAFSEVSGIEEAESDPFKKMETEDSVNEELERLKRELNNNNNN